MTTATSIRGFQLWQTTASWDIDYSLIFVTRLHSLNGRRFFLLISLFADSQENWTEITTSRSIISTMQFHDPDSRGRCGHSNLNNNLAVGHSLSHSRSSRDWHLLSRVCHILNFIYLINSLNEHPGWQNTSKIVKWVYFWYLDLFNIPSIISRSKISTWTHLPGLWTATRSLSIR